MKLKDIEIYTDGACSGNPGPGGWCAILKYKGNEKIVSGYEKQTTNNRMELLAVIRGIEAVKQKCNIKLYSDSAYLINAMKQGWLHNWKRNGWRKKNKSEVLNKDLWLELDSLIKQHNLEWIKVKGHSDNEYNNKCDEIARNEIFQVQR